jgi:hypothetical protein
MTSPRFYLYVSQTKVDMLLSQIPRVGIEHVAAKLKIDLSILALEVEATLDARLDKTRLVESYLREHAWVGDVDDGAEYISGTMQLSWGEIEDMVIFAGMRGGTGIAMTGSTHSLIGANEKARKNGSLLAATYAAVRGLMHETTKAGKSGIVSDVARLHDATRNAFAALPTQKLEFLAKRFVSRGVPEQRLVLGSPIFVAMAE